MGDFGEVFGLVMREWFKVNDGVLSFMKDVYLRLVMLGIEWLDLVFV